MRLDLFEISSVYNYDEVIVRQRAVAEKIGKKYGIKPFVTTEISGAGQHKNCFSTWVPVLDYSKEKITTEMAIAHVKAHGGIFSYNHPFESSKYKRVEFTREQLDGVVAYEIDHLASNKVYGASLMEVGFPIGRGLFTINDHLTLWDNLAYRGVFITGYGDSDSHKSNSAWFVNNNFASWIGVDEDIPHPVPEEKFIEAMVAGRIYMGDPVELCGEVEFGCLGAAMGSVIVSDGGEYPITLRLTDVKPTHKVRIVNNGEAILEANPEGDSFEATVPVLAGSGVTVVRAEMYREDGRCIMLTNPIYLVGPDYEGDIAKERLVKVLR